MSAPIDLLGRVRLASLIATFFAGLTILPLIMTNDERSVFLRIGASIAVFLLGARRVDATLNDRHGWPWDLASALLVFTITFALLDPMAALLVLYTGVVARALTDHLSSVVRVTTLTAAAFLLGMLPGTHARSELLLTPATIFQIVGIGATATIAYILAQSVTSHQRALAREAALRDAGSRLVAAVGTAGIHEAAIDSLRRLIEPLARVDLRLITGESDALTIVAAYGGRAEQSVGNRINPRDILPAVLSAIRCGDRSEVEYTVSMGMRSTLGYSSNSSVTIVVPLLFHHLPPGAIVVATSISLPEELKDGIDALASQVALALESAMISERLLHERGEARFRSLVQNASDIVTIAELDGTIRYQSPAIEHILGYSTDATVGSNVMSFVHADDLDAVIAAFQKVVLTEGTADPVTYRFRHLDGAWRHVESIGNNLIGDPDVAGIVINSRDVTQRMESDQLLRQTEQHYRRLVELGPLITYIEAHDEVNTAMYYSPQVEEVLGYTFEDFTANPMLWESLIHPDDAERVIAENEATNETHGRFSVEYRHQTRDGRYVWIRDDAVLIEDDDGQPLYWQGTKIDISEQKRLEGELSYQAFHDALTGLPNRALFVDRLDHAIARTGREARTLAVLFLDMDAFKVINDSLGHEVGDELLVAFGERLNSTIRPGDTVARLGGDEFTILLENLASPDEAVGVADRVAEVLRTPFRLAGNDVVVSASVGITIRKPGGGSATDLLRQADMAMYAAKEAGRAGFQLFEERMDAQALDRLRLERDLRLALEREEFIVYYQPIIHLESGAITEVEALVRWEHPVREIVSPGEFIPLAEATGLILPLGEWVLREACRQISSWQESEPTGSPIVLSVNLSARQFQQPHLPQTIAGILLESGFPAAQLKLEITESLAMVDAVSSIATMRELKALGIALAIDDFGTGYSSLAFLQQFPVDVLKIDRSFISGLATSDDSSAIVRSIIAIAQSLSLSVTAEGIETHAQMAVLTALGCDRSQGYLFAKPMPAEQFVLLLVDHRLAHAA